MGNRLVNQFIDDVSDLSVLVVGETIIDEFVEVIYQGQSMKSFCPVFRFTDGSRKVQQGGVGAIAGHLKDFVKNVDVVTNTNNEIVKTRFVDKDGKKKHIEFNKIANQGFEEVQVDVGHYDVVIVADFGHGFLDHLYINDGFHLMCQTNSYNFGFNRLSKWKQYKKKSVCLDLREASLQVNKKMSSCIDQEAKEIYKYEINCYDLFITLGADGALYTNGTIVKRQDVIQSQIADTIGAGDTFFAFAALTSHLGYKDKLLIPSLAASLSTTWICNEEVVMKDKLLEYADRKL